jgi:[ribosomal protein S5]-alanine N-acetyltransferase
MRNSQLQEHLLILRPIHIDDFQAVLNWSQDEVFCEANGWDLNRTTDELFNWWKKCVENKNAAFIRIGIELNDTLIGYGDLAYMNGSEAEVGIAIGESSLWGQGLGQVATVKLIDYGKSIGITTFLAETHETNSRARKMLERIGFEEISRHGTELYKEVETALIQFKLNI